MQLGFSCLALKLLFKSLLPCSLKVKFSLSAAISYTVRVSHPASLWRRHCRWPQSRLWPVRRSRAARPVILLCLFLDLRDRKRISLVFPPNSRFISFLSFFPPFLLRQSGSFQFVYLFLSARVLQLYFVGSLLAPRFLPFLRPSDLLWESSHSFIASSLQFLI